MDLLYHSCTFLQRRTLSLFADCKIEGRENVPPMGPLIIVANHQGNFDPPLLGAVMPRRVRFLAKDGLFRNPASRWFMSTYGGFPLKRDRLDVGAYKWALDHLEHGGALVLFPEGTRSPGGMMKALPGIARLALRSQALLLPVGITGTGRIGHWLRVFNPTGRIRVNIGHVFTLPSIEGRVSKDVMESLTEMIMRRVADLLPASYRGVYGVQSQHSVPRGTRTAERES